MKYLATTSAALLCSSVFAADDISAIGLGEVTIQNGLQAESPSPNAQATSQEMVSRPRCSQVLPPMLPDPVEHELRYRTKEQVSPVIKAMVPKIMAHFRDAQKVNPCINGELFFAISIKADGSVGDVTYQSSTTEAVSIAEQIKADFKGITFSASNGVDIVDYSISLAP